MTATQNTGQVGSNPPKSGANDSNADAKAYAKMEVNKDKRRKKNLRDKEVFL